MTTGKDRQLVAVFGSLKAGCYNHPALGANAVLKGKTTVMGVMYLHGGYPRLYHAIDEEYSPFDVHEEREHAVEVYEIDDLNYQAILQMELGAGYEEEELMTEWGAAKIYFNPHDVYSPEYDEWIPAYPVKE